MKNFSWIGTWSVTNRCNLRCAYCEPRRMPASAHEPIDYDRAVRRIAEHRPKVLNISGGEPSLVKELPELLKRIKRNWDPFIRIVSNGTRTSELVSSLPWFDRLVVSLDGLGETNRKTRGIDGYRVLDEVRAFRRKAFEAGRDLPEIVINQVVTVDNAGEIRELAEAAARIDPDMEVAFSALVPNDHPLSISRHKKVWDRFWEEYETLRSEGKRVWHHFGAFKTCEPVKTVQCYNQYFVIRFRPDGIPVTCSPDLSAAARHGKGYALEVLKKPSLIPKALGKITQAAAGSLYRKPKFLCRTPCNCESWIDDLLMGREHANLDYYFRPLKGRFTKEEVKEVTKWVREFVNPGFDGEELRGLANKGA